MRGTTCYHLLPSFRNINGNIAQDQSGAQGWIRKTDSALFSNIKDVGFNNRYLMHDDVNDGERNLEYAAGGVIWPTPLL